MKKRVGMFNKKTIENYAIAGKTVLLRADYNVPLDDKHNVTSDYRLAQSLPTIKALQDKNCKIVIISHLGRPKSKADTQFSLKPVAKELSKLLKQPVLFANDCIGDDVAEAAKGLKPKEILLLENLRFYPEEKKNDKNFAQEIVSASNAAVFVQDGFGVVHRAHASTDAITKLLPSISGLLLEKEAYTITAVMKEPKRPLMAIIGGAKIADKITIIDEFIKKADIVAIGGAMANTFLLAQGVEVGDSLVDKDELDTAQDVMDMARAEAKKRNFVFYLPQDGVVAKEVNNKTHTRIVDWDAHVIADIESYPAKPNRSAFKVANDEKILDIGPFSGAFIAGAMQMVDTVVWNGTMGVSEVQAVGGPVGPFAHGTELVIDGLVGRFGHKPFSLLGGGDTIAYVEQRGMTDMFNHVSTGGGASLELMGGKQLPGIEALLDKES
jgi:3-phosphoglycerate kinase